MARMSQLVLPLCLRHITILYLWDTYAPFTPLIDQIIPFLLRNDFNFTVAWEVNGVSTGKQLWMFQKRVLPSSSEKEGSALPW